MKKKYNSNIVLVWRIPTVVFPYNESNSVHHTRQKVTGNHNRILHTRIHPRGQGYLSLVHTLTLENETDSQYTAQLNTFTLNLFPTRRKNISTIINEHHHDQHQIGKYYVLKLYLKIDCSQKHGSSEKHRFDFPSYISEFLDLNI